MERRLLITVGDDKDSLYGVRFVGPFFESKADLRLTLLHVAPRFESMDTRESLLLHRIDEMLAEIYGKKGHEALEMSRKILLREGFSDGQIESRLILKHYGMIKDILAEAKQEKCHAVILGRRGHSIFERVFFPSFSREMMAIDLDVPLWICKRPSRGLENVLLCVDGSDSSLRIGEHVVRMVGEESRHQITLLHVDDENGRNVEEIMGTARRRLLEAGMPKERIRDLVIRARDVAKAIWREAAANSYAVVAVGRHGMRNEDAPDRGFMSSKGMELLEMLNKPALWVGW